MAGPKNKFEMPIPVLDDVDDSSPASTPKETPPEESLTEEASPDQSRTETARSGDGEHTGAATSPGAPAPSDSKLDNAAETSTSSAAKIEPKRPKAEDSVRDDGTRPPNPIGPGESARNLVEAFVPQNANQKTKAIGTLVGIGVGFFGQLLSKKAGKSEEWNALSQRIAEDARQQRELAQKQALDRERTRRKEVEEARERLAQAQRIEKAKEDALRASQADLAKQKAALRDRAAMEAATKAATEAAAQARKAADDLQRRNATAKINRGWLSHGAIVGGVRGVRLHIDFSIIGMQGTEGLVAAFLYYADGGIVRDKNGEFTSAEGGVAVTRTLTPPFARMYLNDFELFLPYHEFHLSVRRVELYFRICVMTSPSSSNLAEVSVPCVWTEG